MTASNESHGPLAPSSHGVGRVRRIPGVRCPVTLESSETAAPSHIAQSSDRELAQVLPLPVAGLGASLAEASL